MSDAQNTGNQARDTGPTRLRDALRQARIEAADRTGVVVELRDAEVARRDHALFDPSVLEDAHSRRRSRTQTSHSPAVASRGLPPTDRRG